MSRLLINEPPLQVLPSLARVIGLNEAIVLQQIHYWLQHGKHEWRGAIWVYRTHEDWSREFGFWSEKTFSRTVKKLETLGLVRVEKLHGELFNVSHNQTKWYTIVYERMDQLEYKIFEQSLGGRVNTEPDKLSGSKETNCPVGSGQIVRLEGDRMSGSMRTKCPVLCREYYREYYRKFFRDFVRFC